MTHKTVEEQKRKVVVPKADNPARKYMSKEDAVAENARLRDDRVKIDQYAKQLEEERTKANSREVIVDEVPAKDIVPNPEIAKLEEKLASQKGPGSKARKAKIQEQIEELKSK